MMVELTVNLVLPLIYKHILVCLPNDITYNRQLSRPAAATLMEKI